MTPIEYPQRGFDPPPRMIPGHAGPVKRRRDPPLTVRCPCGCLVYVNVSRVSAFTGGMAEYWTADTDWCPACRRRLRIAVEMDNWTHSGTPNVACLTLVERETMPFAVAKPQTVRSDLWEHGVLFTICESRLCYPSPIPPRVPKAIQPGDRTFRKVACTWTGRRWAGVCEACGTEYSLTRGH